MKQIILIISTFTAMPIAAQPISATPEQSNYHFSHTDSTQVPSEKIWEVWIDVPNWKQWDNGLKDAMLEGNFEVGAKGTLLPDKGPKSEFIISKLVPNKSYTFKTKIPFGWLIIERTLEVRNGTTYFTHYVKFTGILKKILGNKLGKNYMKILPEVLKKIKLIAEQK